MAAPDGTISSDGAGPRLRAGSPDPRRGVSEPGSSDPTVRVVDLLQAIGRQWHVLALVWAAVIVAALGYYLLAPKYYAATTTLVAVEERQGGLGSSLLGQLSDALPLGGLPLGGQKPAEALAVLRSRDFVLRFIEEEKIAPLLFPDDWSAERGAWVTQPTPARLFDRFEALRQVVENKRFGTILLSIEWTDPVLAAKWTNRMVASVNAKLRQQALVAAESKLAQLEQEMRRNSLVTMQQATMGLIEREMGTMLLARTREDFAFKVVDPAIVLDRPTRPRLLPTVGAGLVLGAIAGVLTALGVGAWRRNASESSAA